MGLTCGWRSIYENDLERGTKNIWSFRVFYSVFLNYDFDEQVTSETKRWSHITCGWRMIYENGLGRGWS